MNFEHIGQTAWITAKRLFVSVVVLALPLALIYRFFIWSAYSPPLWAYYELVVKIVVFEHIYRMLAKATLGKEVGWENIKINPWAPRALFRTAIVLIIGEAIQIFFPMALRLFGKGPHWLLLTLAIIFLYGVSLLVYVLNFSLVAFAMDEKTKLFTGIREAFVVAKHNMLFYCLVVFLYSLIGLIPVVGPFLGTVFLLFSEYIRCHLYAFVFSHKFEDRATAPDYDEEGQSSEF